MDTRLTVSFLLPFKNKSEFLTILGHLYFPFWGTTRVFRTPWPDELCILGPGRLLFSLFLNSLKCPMKIMCLSFQCRRESFENHKAIVVKTKD